MHYEEKQITLNEVSVSFIEAGPADARPVIFIHGFPFNKSMWDAQLMALKNNYRCIAYDVRGHGNSEAGKADFSIDLFADDLLAFTEALNLEKPVVCGLSMGGYIALNAIQKSPDHFAGLILADTQCGADTPEGKEKRLKTITFIQKNGLEVYAEESLKNLFAPASFKARPKDVAFIKETILATSPETICRTLLALANRKETCSGLAEISVPVCVLVGKEDKITPPAIAQKMAASVSGSKLVIIEKAGHLANLETPQEFNSHVLNFLNSVYR